MPKKALIFFAFLLFVNNANLVVYANSDDYDYEELYKYDGFGRTLYESVYRETTYLMGEHTKNKEYVEKTIEQVGEYANYVYDQIYGKEYNCGQGWSTAGECLKGLFTNYSAGVITITDYLYDLLKGFWEKDDENVDLPEGSDFWIIKVIGDDTYGFVELNDELGYSTSVGYWRLYLENYSSDYSNLSLRRGPYEYSSKYVEPKVRLPRTLVELDNILRTYFDGAYVTYKGQPVFQKNPIKIVIGNALSDYSKNKGTITKPKPIPKLACGPDNLTLEIRNGSDFYDKQGNKVNVSYDGNAIYNGKECKLTWLVPNMYYDKDGVPVIEEPNGEKKHIETGGDVYIPPSTDVCDKNVFCYLTKLLDSFVKFFDNLTNWFIKVFVPEDITFISESIDNLNNKFNEKIGVLNEVKNSLTNGLEETDENVLKNIELRLPILNNKPIPFINFEYVDPFVHYAKKFLSGVIVLYTLLHVYRKIVGSGGVMEK